MAQQDGPKPESCAPGFFPSSPMTRKILNTKLFFSSLLSFGWRWGGWGGGVWLQRLRGPFIPYSVSRYIEKILKMNGCAVFCITQHLFLLHYIKKYTRNVHIILFSGVLTFKKVFGFKLMGKKLEKSKKKKRGKKWIFPGGGKNLWHFLSSSMFGSFCHQ